MSGRWSELGRPTRQFRSCSVQFGWRPWFSVEGWLDTGYEGSRFEFRFSLTVGAWGYDFDWRPA